MKLRTRIIAISCAMLLTASLTVDIITLTLMWKSIKNEAFIKAYQNSYVKLHELNQKFIQTGESANKEFLEYLLKSYSDQYIICLYDENGKIEDLYNDTIFDKEYLEKLEYTIFQEMQYSHVKYEGRKYIVFKAEFSEFDLYRFEDITYTEKKYGKPYIFICINYTADSCSYYCYPFLHLKPRI